MCHMRRREFFAVLGGSGGVALCGCGPGEETPGDWNAWTGHASSA